MEKSKNTINQGWTTIIKPKNGWVDINLKEIIQYRDLILLFVKRNYTTRYKQTVLGPLWLIISPMITVLMYTFIFGNLAGLSTDGAPQIAFYLAGNAIWSYFASCINGTANTFTANAGIFGKVYFPRLTMPISNVLTSMLDLFIQLIMLVFIIVFYSLIGINININLFILFLPLLIIQCALLGLGVGVMVSALTTRYRDLVVLVGFGVQLWMYISPVVYSISNVPEKYQVIYLLNPVAPIIIMFRYALFSTGSAPLMMWGISWIVTISIVGLGIMLFSKVEKTFMDTV